MCILKLGYIPKRSEVLYMCILKLGYTPQRSKVLYMCILKLGLYTPKDLKYCIWVS